jgi:hypothetical protein
MKTNFKSKFLSLLLVSTMLLSATPVMAAEGDQTVPVDLTVETPIFSVGVPLTLPITITETGEILTSDAVAIINNSAGPVVIKNVQIKGIDGWKTVAYSTVDMKNTTVNTKKVSMQLIFGDEATGTRVSTTGENTTDFSTPIRIAKGETIPLPYKAEVPVQTTAYDSIQVAEITFSFGWDD